MFRYAMKFSIFVVLLLGVLSLITTPIVWAGDLHHSRGGYEQEGGVTPAFIIPLFPLKLNELMKMKGLPPGMTPYSFWAARGTVALTKLTDGKVRLAFSFRGLIPYGVYTLWNVLETDPFKDEPLGEFGAGKHSVVSDGNGRAHKVVVLNKWPGKEFLLDYHADGALSQSKGVYPGALWGKFPPEPKR